MRERERERKVFIALMRNTTIGDDYFAPFIFHIDQHFDIVGKCATLSHREKRIKATRKKKRILSTVKSY